MLVPSAALAAGLAAGAAVRLRGWWAVGVVAPLVSVLAYQLLPSNAGLNAVVAVTVYAATGAASTAIIESRQ
jgi:hypothetical protein